MNFERERPFFNYELERELVNYPIAFERELLNVRSYDRLNERERERQKILNEKMNEVHIFSIL